MATDMDALGDIVQAVVEATPDVIAFVLIREDGVAEYRSPLPEEHLKAILIATAEAF